MSKIVEEYQQKTRKSVLQKINGLQDSSIYLDNKLLRIELAGLYKQVKNIGNGHPVASWFINSIPEILQKNVSNSCSSCVKEARMLSEIKTAITHLKKYAIELGGVEQTEIEPPKSIHELRPNLEQ